jgi:hypothetical protein
MEEHVIVRELAVLMSSKDVSPLTVCLNNYANARKAKLGILMGRVSSDVTKDEKMARKFATKVRCD